jgi:hypothetical protein
MSFDSESGAPVATASEDTTAPWFVVGWCLFGAALVILVAAIVQAYLQPQTARHHLDFIVYGGLGIVTAGLLLGAAVTARAAGQRAAGLQIAVMVFAAVVVAGAIYAIIDALTVHVPDFNDQSSLSVGVTSGGWRERLIVMLPAFAAGLIAVGAIAVTRMRSSVEVAAAE